MGACSVHFICALHQKWNVRAHVCGQNGPAFGKRASEMWSKQMQWAEGPLAFKHGYRKLARHFAGDTARMEYLQELFHDDSKALYKKDYHFSNGVVVDVCESLISAAKSWIMGRFNKNSVSLLLAVVRLVQGVRDMVLRSFLIPVALVKKRTVDRVHNPAVRTLLNFWIGKLTAWAIEDMYKNLDGAGRYD